MRAVRLLVADGGHGIYERLVDGLDGNAAVELSGTVRYADETLVATRRFRPDVVLLEAALAIADEFALVARLHELTPAPTVVLVATAITGRDAEAARRAGVRAVLDATDLVRGVIDVARTLRPDGPTLGTVAS